MVTQVNVLMKAQKNLLIVFQDCIVFSFFLEFFPILGGFLMLSEGKAVIFFSPKIKVSLHTCFVRQSWKNMRTTYPGKMPVWRPLPCFLVPMDSGGVSFNLV